VDYAWPEGAGAWRQRARAYVEEVLRPLEGALPPAEGGLPPGEDLRCRGARRAAGLWGLAVPAELGGAGLPVTLQAAVAEELGRSLLGLDPHGLLAAGEVPWPLLRAGDGELRAACLVGARQAWQLDGSGLAATRLAGGVRLEGTLAAVPEYMVRDVVVLALPGGGAAILEAGAPGWAASPPRPTMGSAQLVDVRLEGCEVPARRLAPGGAAGWQALRRVVLAASALGAAARCLEAALEHARRRHTFGKPLAERQAIQWMLADSARELHAARLLCYQAASEADRGADAGALASAAKVLGAEAGCRIADRALQIHGGYGYSRDLPFERYWRDLRYYRVLEGTGEDLAAGWAGLLP
jgi:acyl-CoA dehydrogenase